MTQVLPSNPDLEQLRKQAKEILKSHKQGDRSCCSVLRNLRQFKSSTDEEILKSTVGLQEAQHALAVGFGFVGWAELKSCVDQDLPMNSRLKGDLPPGRPDSVDYAQGLSMLLSYATGASVDYHTVMGDTGLAFIFQAESESTNRIDGAVDVGWWPLAPWGIDMRRDFLGRTVGRRILGLPEEFDRDEYKSDEALFCSKHFMPTVTESIAAGTPVLARGGSWVFVTGYDDEEPPLLGHCARADGNSPERIDMYPWLLVYLGEECQTISRADADSEALAHAIALIRDTAKVPGGWSSGLKSFEAWIRALDDTDNLGEARWHANLCYQFRLNRVSAIAYLNTMAERHPQAADHLGKAATQYDEVLKLIDQADTGDEALMSAEGRRDLVRLAERMRDAETIAVKELEAALASIS